ncbi:MAG: hypothetical protein ABSC94_08840 [Polyangiaceae bacterium]
MSSRSDEGLLVAEYALFDPADIVLRATDPVSVREAGYMTTARDAILRLARAGITQALAEEAAIALSPDVAASFARGAAVRALIGRLGPQELFDGEVYVAAKHTYDGAWLDLASLTPRLHISNPAALLQALHLAAVLSEVPGGTPVHLSTAAVTKDRRPGERTHVRVALEDAARMPEALRLLASNPEPVAIDATDDRRIGKQLLTRVRERLTPDATPRLRTHLALLESSLTTRTMPIGPLADPDLQAIERQLASGDPRGIDAQLDALERERGHSAGLRYLRARAALLRGDGSAKNVAQILSELAQEELGLHEAALVAARTWLGTSEDGQGRYLARQPADDHSAPERERLGAVDPTDATNGTAKTRPAPPMAVPAEFMHGEQPKFVSPPVAVYPPALDDAPAPKVLFTTPPLAPPRGSSPGPGDPSAPHFDETSAGSEASPNGGEELPRIKGMVLERYDPELIESLVLPMGASEAALSVNELPKTSLQARIAMTRLARDLARDYRLWYKKSLRCNVLAIDAMQQHLTQRFAGAPISDEGVAWELRRHGALFSEILARALGAGWVDIGPSEPGYWSMAIPTGTRIWPIGRVCRFVALGHSARDLVGYYLDLEARVRGRSS